MFKIIVTALVLIGSPLSAFAEEATTTPEITPTVTITIRDGSLTAFSGSVPLAASTSGPVEIMPTNSSTTIAVPADSLLATLVALDATTTDFDITDLAYFSSFGAFIINCISFPVNSSPSCFNWTYAVNATFPQMGADDYILHDGDIVYLFFGSSRQTVLSTSTVSMGEAFSATAQQYDLNTGTYIGAAGLTLGVAIANPDYTFTEISTSTSDAEGHAIFTVHATGTYSVGIQEDGYFPAATITIVDPPEVTDPAPGGGSTDTPPTPPDPAPVFNMQNALAFLASKQSQSGSFGSPLLDDWAAIAFASTNSGAPKELLKSFVLATLPALSGVTDYERHALALMSLGINPYSGTSRDHIAPITNAFDGTQIGDPSLDNDDIFAILALVPAGYGPRDSIIQKTGAFILSKQQPNGSWDNSVDMTAAGIQAVSLLFGTPGIKSSTLGQSLGMAAGYLAAKQLPDGGWENVDSTSWVQTMINATKESDPTRASDWRNSSGKVPMDAIAAAQQSDGGVRPTADTDQNRIWSTAYAITAASSKSWLSIPQRFQKPAPTTASDSGGGSTWTPPATSTSPTSTASTTQEVATSTTVSATTTAIVLGASTTTVATSTASTTKSVSPKPTAKKIVVKKQPSKSVAATTTKVQLAKAAAAVPAKGFLSTLWQSITSFVASLF